MIIRQFFIVRCLEKPFNFIRLTVNFPSKTSIFTYKCRLDTLETAESARGFECSLQKIKKVYPVEQCPFYSKNINSESYKFREITQKMSDASGPPATGPPILGKPFKLFEE